MLIQAFVPFITFATAYGEKYVRRYFDGRSSRKDITERISIQNYVILYSGPDVALPLRYSALMNNVWVAFAFGIGIPMLFPICCLGILNMYITERLQFAWFYKKPPMMGNILNEKSLGVLLKAPIGMAITGYYMLGNRQMFHNE